MISDQVFILHTRPFRETSQLVSLFSRRYGRFSAVSRGSRGKGRRGGTSLQPFCLLHAEWRGSTELKTLVSAEPLEIHLLQGDKLYVGLYLNELLSRLVHEYESCAELFDHYCFMLSILSAEADVEPHLRVFELNLLQDLGYGFAVDIDATTGETVDSTYDYVFIVGEGMVPAGRVSNGTAISGAQLRLIAAGDYSSRETRVSAKRLTRAALAPLLGPKPLYSRELFRDAVLSAGAQR